MSEPAKKGGGLKVRRFSCLKPHGIPRREKNSPIENNQIQLSVKGGIKPKAVVHPVRLTGQQVVVGIFSPSHFPSPFYVYKSVRYFKEIPVSRL